MLTLEDALALKVLMVGTVGHETVNTLAVDRRGGGQVGRTVYAGVMVLGGVGDVDGVEGRHGRYWEGKRDSQVEWVEWTSQEGGSARSGGLFIGLLAVEDRWTDSLVWNLGVETETLATARSAAETRIGRAPY